MRNSKTIFLILFVTASVVASLLIRHRADAAILGHAALLQQQTQHLADLQTEQQRLSNLIARATNIPVADHSAELTKLRAEAEALRKQTNELARQSKRSLTLSPSRSTSKPEIHNAEYWEQMSRARGNKGEDALYLSDALWDYAMDHQRQYPSSLDQAAPYLAKEHHTLSGTNQFEIIFQGSVDQLEGLPNGSIAGIRETQTWLTPDGRGARVYGMIPDGGQTVESEDNFQSWESEHVIPGPSLAK